MAVAERAGGGGPALLLGLPPILDAEIHTLILGSFPSPASLAAQHYYGHPQNQFWRLLGALLEEPLAAMDYHDKRRGVLRHHIGIWDVFRRCRRQGALDAAIQAAEANDFSHLPGDAPRLRRICFNGQTAGRFADLFARQGYETVILPSSSPAYTLNLQAKLAKWRAGILLPLAGDANGA